MRIHPIILGAGALLLMAAQDPPEAPAAPQSFTEAFAEQSNAAAAAQTAEVLEEPAPVPSEAPPEVDAGAPAAKGKPPTREFMIGVWAQPGQKCETALDFKADGSLIGPFPRWELTDGVLTMVGNRQKIWLTVVDQNTLHSRRSETDPPRKLTRCPTPAPAPGERAGPASPETGR